ncbi:MAG: hypothetical protein ACOC95_01200 [Planctomycetota bacterium]
MSLWGMAYMGNLYRRQSRAATQASSDASSAKMSAREVSDRLDKLTMICHAMWTLLQETTDLTEEDLFERMQELDMRDGVLDGKVTRTVYTCPKCGRNSAPRHNRCLYCGAPRTPESAFDQV